MTSTSAINNISKFFDVEDAKFERIERKKFIASLDEALITSPVMTPKQNISHSMQQ